MDRAPFCSQCPIGHLTTGYVPLVEVDSDYLIVGEAAGKDEAAAGKPFIGGAGSWLNNLLRQARVSRSKFNIINTIGCFVSSKTSVYTRSGWKQLGKVTTDDLILTHQGRFQPCLGVIKNPPPSDYVVKIYLSNGNHVTVTSDHRFYDGESWVYASQLSVGNSLNYVAEHCLICDKLFVRKFKHTYKSLPFCSYTCHNKYVGSKSGQALSASMKEQYLSGKRDRYTITKAANTAVKLLQKEGKCLPPHNDDVIRRRRVSAALARQAIGLDVNLPWVGFGEMQLADLLEASGYDFTPQFALNGYNYDFKVGNVLIEVEGPGALQNTARQRVDSCKNSLADENGYKVIRVPHYNIIEALNHLENDNHEYSFMPVTITKIEYKKWNRPTWTLAVEEDESYVSQGLVSHNCRPPDNAYPLDGQKWKYTSREAAREAVAYCSKHHLEPALAKRKWTRVIAFGNWALLSLTGKRGISLWRGSPLQLKFWSRNEPPVVMPTLHPANIMRDTTYFDVVKYDITRSLQVPKENYTLFATVDDLKAFTSTEFAFDLEWDREGTITLCGLSDGYYSGLVTNITDDVLAELKRIFESATALIGQNIIQADLPMFRKMGWTIKAKLHDTMLKQHLVQPAYKHDLGFIASVWTQGVFWKGRGEEEEDEYGESYEKQQWRTWDSPDAIPIEYGGYGGCTSADESYRLYNARDTSKAYEVNVPLDAAIKQNDLESLYWNSQVPVATICQEITEGGWKIDPQKLATIRTQLDSEILTLESQLPDGLRPYDESVTKQVDAPPGSYKPKTKRCKGSKKEGTAHDVQEIIFTEPADRTCPVCGKTIQPGKLTALKKIRVPATKRIVPWNSSKKVIKYAEDKGIKVQNDRKTGNKSADKGARKVWSKNYPEFITVNELKVKQTLCSNFTKESWKNLYRVFYSIKVHGTKEGRFSCVGSRRGLDPNLQQMPKSARHLFIPDHDDWGILQADWKSGENMLTAHLANDVERLTRLRTPGYNEHIDLASRMFDREVTKADEAFYKAGKKVNHGRNYGMGPRKLQEAILEETGTLFPEKEVKGFIEEWKRLNDGTARWQAATVREVELNGYLTNPFGRKLWFTHPRDFATKALAFLPASTLADVMILSMISLYGDRFGEELMNSRVSKTTTILKPFRFMLPVHDSFVFQGPKTGAKEMGERLRIVMSQPWVQLDNFSLDVELEWSGVGGSWGDCTPEKYEALL